jgi:hypothetical protein
MPKGKPDWREFGSTLSEFKGGKNIGADTKVDGCTCADRFTLVLGELVRLKPDELEPTALPIMAFR